MKVLFVCTANICRSAYAELLARHRYGDKLTVASAGTHARGGEPVDGEMTAQLPAGADLDAFRSRLLTPGMLADADLVLVMEAAHREFVLRDWPEHFKKVFTLGQAAAGVQRLRADGVAEEQIVRRLSTSRGHADPALDVADPYRRGPEAAAAAARRIAQGLDVVLPALLSR